MASRIRFSTIKFSDFGVSSFLSVSLDLFATETEISLGGDA